MKKSARITIDEIEYVPVHEHSVAARLLGMLVEEYLGEPDVTRANELYLEITDDPSDLNDIEESRLDVAVARIIRKMNEEK